MVIAIHIWVSTREEAHKQFDESTCWDPLS